MKKIKVLASKSMSNFGGVCIHDIDEREEKVTYFETYGESITKPKKVKLYHAIRKGFYFMRNNTREYLSEYMRNNFEIAYDEKTLKLL